MLKYHFDIIKATPLKGHKLQKTKDYETKVTIEKDGQLIFDEVIMVRKNIKGVFPELTEVNKKIASVAIRKELTDRLKEYFKKIK